MSRNPYIQELSKTRWYFKHPRYLRYMAREVTCIFIGAYTLLLLVGLMRLAEGKAQYDAFLQALSTPCSITFHCIALVFSLYHTITWFNVAPKALPLQMGEAILPDAVVATAHYVVWVVLSIGILYWGVL